MAKYTLLEIVQTVLSSMDSDEVSSITDTVESQQVVKVVKTAYYDLLNRGALPETFSVINLDETTAATPVIMTVPANISEIKWIKYDNATAVSTDTNMTLVSFLPLNSFFDRMDTLSESDTVVGSFTHTADSGDSFKVLYWNDRFPQFYTILDDTDVIFDAYNGVDTTDTYLTAAKTRAYARRGIAWSETDGFTFTLDEPQFALFVNEAKSLAWAELKQTPHLKAEQVAKRGWTHLQNHKHNVQPLVDFDQLPYFGRK